MKLNIVTSEEGDDEVLEREAKKLSPKQFKAHMFKSRCER